LDNYEIRIVRPGHQACIYVSPQLSDHAAIRRAQSLAQDGDCVQVWRGLDCVYEKRDGKPRFH
jgi:hypothetical protein